MKVYTELEMLNLYRNHLGLSRVLTLPAEQERKAVDKELLDVLRKRYLSLLATRDTALLPVEDMGAEATLSYDGDYDMLTLRLPGRCIRPVSIRVKGWRQAVYSFLPAGTPLHRRQTIPMLRARSTAPLVFRSEGSLMAYGIPPFKAGEMQCELRAVAAPADGSFIMDESLLPEMIY